MIHLPFIVMETHEITTLYIFKQKGVCLTLEHKDRKEMISVVTIQIRVKQRERKFSTRTNWR